MKFKLLVLFLLFSSTGAFAQDSKFSVEANFPIPIDDNFIGQNYGGIVEIGVAYIFSESDVVNFGASVNAGLLKNSKVLANNPFDVKLYPIQPRVFVQFNIKSLAALHPQVGLGYSFLVFNSESNGNNPEFGDLTINRTDGGINLNIGLAYDISERFFLQAQYDYIRNSVADGLPDISYNTQVNFLKVGVGFRI